MRVVLAKNWVTRVRALEFLPFSIVKVCLRSFGDRYATSYVVPGFFALSFSGVSSAAIAKRTTSA